MRTLEFFRFYFMAGVYIAAAGRDGDPISLVEKGELLERVLAIAGQRQ